MLARELRKAGEEENSKKKNGQQENLTEGPRLKRTKIKRSTIAREHKIK